MVTQVISGGQTGADRAALETAKELGIATGGWAPKGYRTETGPDPSLADFGLQEAKDSTYTLRTELNVEMADGTVIFGNAVSAGSRLTIWLCVSKSKPYICNPTASELRDWIETNSITTLNVAGNRRSVNPGVATQVRDVLREALQ